MLVEDGCVRQGVAMGAVLLIVLSQIVEDITLMRIQTVSHC